MTKQQAHDWVAKAADDAIATASPGASVVTCASGISPSGPIHLGNLREILVPHLVAEELRRRGVPCRHILSWDDFDRLRKIPAGVPDAFSEHIGRPLTKIPDPSCEYPSWADRFKAPFREALKALGIDIIEISQTEMYQSGRYRSQILKAVRRRDTIEDVLSRYRTKTGTEGDDASAPAAELVRFPFRPYCASCGRDRTVVQRYNDDTTDTAYACEACGFSGSTNLAKEDGGKLVWKVDWPMRWAFEEVSFEAAGVDHSTPGSSFTVGSQIVREIYGGHPPAYMGYSFVGIQGMAKMSGSAGRVPTPSDALGVLEAPVLRWLYARRKPSQAITIELGQEVVRVYDEWDSLRRQVESSQSNHTQQAAYERASITSLGELPQPEVPVPFRTLSSIIDIAAGAADQISRIVNEVGYPHDTIDQLQPRFDRAKNWIENYVEEKNRTVVRQEPDTSRLSDLSQAEATWLALLLERMPDEPGLEEITRLVYGVPKVALGLDLDAEPNSEIIADQKAFFRLLYQLLIGKDTGPRLPTLFLALGSKHLRRLLNVGRG
jgi:lysyl-tRNA synthetase class 1